MGVKRTVELLRRQAIYGSLGAPKTLGRAIGTLGFVQADPIRAPARAQDLILRHRVPDYRAGELERRFPRLRLEEDFLYAYGFMPAETAQLLHPRPDPETEDGKHVPSGLAADVLAFVRQEGATHPAALADRLGRERAVNGWGGFSQATTRALQRLHYHGLLRVVRRRDGIRIYEAAPQRGETLAPDERARRIALLVIRVLAPLPDVSLASTFGLLRRGAPGLSGWRDTIQTLLQSGELASSDVDGTRYLWPADYRIPRSTDAERQVRFLTPFDPIVWDRKRFELLWGWPYRFEAYTPAEKRQHGYYAMPLLWGDDIIGWVNLTSTDGRLDVDTGFVNARPKDREFRRAFDAEMARMEAFLAETPPE